MRHYEVFLAVMLLSLPVLAADHAVPARVATLTIDPREVTILNLRPEFESSIRMPEEVTSVILGVRAHSRPNTTRASRSTSTSNPSPRNRRNRIC